jgi:hypothetical protein
VVKSKILNIYVSPPPKKGIPYKTRKKYRSRRPELDPTARCDFGEVQLSK